MNFIESHCFVKLFGSTYYLTKSNQIVSLKEIDSSITDFSAALYSQLELADHVSKCFEAYLTDKKIASKMEKSEYFHLSLEMTEQCNLRCKYCIYSGNYEYERIHSNKFMSKCTVDKIIEHLKIRLKYLKKITIAYYGGEPLLNFELIEYATNKFKTVFNDVELDFRISTNGLLINKYIKFLKENDFAVQISLDGSEEIHDKNRIRLDSSGSFGSVLNAYFLLINNNFRDVNISVTIENWMDFYEISKYFNENFNILHNLSLSYSGVHENLKNSSGKTTVNLYNAELENKIQGNLPLGLFDKSVLSSRFGSIMLRDNKDIFETNYADDGLCKIGYNRFFVRTDGQIYCCVQPNPSYKDIGSIDNGIDYEKLTEINSNYNDFILKYCSKCWAIRLCGKCQANIPYNSNPEIVETKCQNIKKQIRNNLIKYVEYKSNNPVFFQKLRESL